LVDSNGKVVKSAHPGMAVTIAGWKKLPDAGNDVLQGNESDIKKAITNRERRLELASVVEDAEAINIQRKMDRERRQHEQAAAAAGVALPSQPVEDVPKQLRLVIKCDVSGTVEAVEGALQGIGNNKASVKIVRATVGDVVESDILLAKASEGITFNCFFVVLYSSVLQG
jgi:translation initiation factor IF-2